jgi:hypothetical protein
LEDTYRIYLWNYCSGSRSSGEAMHRESRCSERQSGFIFDPVGVFGLNAISLSRQPDDGNKTDNSIVKAIDAVEDDLKNLEMKVLGGTASRALSIYRRVARWNFIAYQCAFWTTLVTITCIRALRKHRRSESLLNVISHNFLRLASIHTSFC